MNSIIFRLSMAIVICVVAGCGSVSMEQSHDGVSTDTVTPMTERSNACQDDLIACARTSTIGDAMPAGEEIASPTGEPLQLGMINQEESPAGSFPDLSASVQAAIEFINEELGGVNGQPIEISVCNSAGTAEGSLNCAERFIDQGVIGVLGGIDIFGSGIELLERNGTPYIGGIPVSMASMTSSTSFQWSGGAWAASIAFANYIAEELGAARVAIVHGEFDAINQAAEFGRAVLESHGVNVTTVPFPVISTDLGGPLSTARASNPDAVIILTADTACRPAMESWAAIGPGIPALYVGACADPNVLNSLPSTVTQGAIFNVEGIVDRSVTQPDFDLYQAVLDTYAPSLDPVGAATVTFRSAMNLYAILQTLEPSALTAANLMTALGDTREQPSFMGHPYSCDGKQLADLIAACSPQQILTEFRDGEFIQLGSWRDVGSLYATSTGR